jgi:uncharacterized phage protein gp47/JayE
MTVPTTQEIADLIIAQLESDLSQTIPILPKAALRVLAKVLAGVFILLYRYAGFIFLQLFVEFATMEQTTINGKAIRPLVEWGRLFGVADPTEAKRAEFVAVVTVKNQTGSLAADSKMVRAETGVVYATATAVALNAPQVTVPIRAVSDQNGGDGSGTVGNLNLGDVLEFASPLANVENQVFITTQTVVGTDAETPGAYRARVRDRARAKPQGGAYADYRVWGEEADGVANIYPYAGKPGEIDVFVEVDADVEPDGIPDSAHLTAVFDAINLNGTSGKATRRPVNAAVNTIAITRTGFDVIVTNLDVPDPVATKSDIAAGLDEYFRSREPFIVGLSVLPRADRITAAAISGIVDTIVSAAGGTVSGVALVIGTFINSYTLGHGEKAKLSNVAYF